MSKVELPHWWGPWQRAKNTFLYLLILCGVALARVMPLFMLRAIGQALSACAYPFASKVPLQQLRQHMPELKHPRTTIFKMFLHLGRLGAEWVQIEKLTNPGAEELDFPAATQQVVKDAIAEGNGVLCVTPHLGNWELYAQAATRHGLPCTTIAKPLFDPRVTQLVDQFRGRSGLVTLWRGDPLLRDKLTQTFRGHGLLGVLIDQDTKVSHVFVPFFGELAATPVVPARLARQYGCAVLFGYAARDGGKYRMHFERVAWNQTDDEAEDALTLTAKLTALTEQAVRRYPSQWMWMHKRWKTRPPAEAQP